MVEDTIQQNESEDAELNATLEALLAAEQARIEEERRQQELGCPAGRPRGPAGPGGAERPGDHRRGWLR